MSPVAPTSSFPPPKQSCSSCILRKSEARETYDGSYEALQPASTTLLPNWPIKDRAGGQEFVTLTITSPSTTYTTTILLGDSFPTSLIPGPTAEAVTESPKKAKTSGIKNGAIIGIVVGCVISFLLLAWVYRVFMLRAKQARRKKKRGRSKSRGSSKRSRRAHRAGPPGPGPGPGPPPPPEVLPDAPPEAPPE